MRILIVDDDRQIILTLKALLSKWGHRVIEAKDGAEAWQILSREKISLVVSDWMMPKVDGLQLCRKIRSENLSTYIYIILLTSRNEKSDLIEGMGAGADDFVSKPFNKNELRVRVRAAERTIELQADLSESNRRLTTTNQNLEQAYATISKDLKSAAEMQKSLLPESNHEIGGIQFHWRFCPANYVAGDILNYYKLNERRLVFYLLDVVGHGVSSAMLSVTINKLLSSDSHISRIFSQQPQLQAHQVVSCLNEQFQSNSDSIHYFTMVYGIFDMFTCRVSLCQAGHPNPIVIAQNKPATEIGSGGFPVGLLPNAEYESIDIKLSSGDRLYLYSDGVTECRTADRMFFGQSRLLDFLEASRNTKLEKSMDELEKRLNKWKGDDHFEDDISILILEMN
jgi:sigma-B regulation protein RsbU (phosphoserine phosphatase)